MDYYQTLQVSRDAEPEVIEKAYRALCLKYHPDVVPDGGRHTATRRMQAINEAYRVLRDPGARKRYDMALPLTAEGHSAWDIFMDKGLLGMLLEKVSSRL